MPEMWNRKIFRSTLNSQSSKFRLPTPGENLKISKKFKFLSRRARFHRNFNYHHSEIAYNQLRLINQKIYKKIFLQNIFTKFHIYVGLFEDFSHNNETFPERHFKAKFFDSGLPSHKSHLTPYSRLPARLHIPGIYHKCFVLKK